MTGIVSTSSFAKALWPGVNKFYGAAYNEYPVEWDKLFDKNTSRRNYEEDVNLTGLGLAPTKAEGAPVSYDSMKQGFISRYVHAVYALGFIITREIMEDDQYDVVAPKRAKTLAFSMRQTKEIIGANVYNNAFSGSFLGGDSSSLISTSHANISGGTWSNRIATVADLSEAALEQAVIDIQMLKNDRGLQIALVPKQLIIPPQLEFEAARILKSTGRPGTDNNDVNALREVGKFPSGVTVNHYLTDTDAWFIRTNAPDGMKYFERRADDFGMDNDFDTENAKFKATARFSFGWTDPRGIYGSPGA